MKSPMVRALFGTGSMAKIMSHLYVESDGKPMHARAIARAAGVPVGSIYLALGQLVDKQLVTKVDGARGPEYCAPHADPRLTGLFQLLRQESVIVQQLRAALKSLKGVEYAGIFGSFARGTTNSESDIDVLVLDTTDSDRFQLIAACQRVAALCNRPVNAEMYGRAEFAERLQQRDPIAQAIALGSTIHLRGKL